MYDMDFMAYLLGFLICFGGPIAVIGAVLYLLHSMSRPEKNQMSREYQHYLYDRRHDRRRGL